MFPKSLVLLLPFIKLHSFLTAILYGKIKTQYQMQIISNIVISELSDFPLVKMGVRIFISGSNGNMQIEQNQHRILTILRSLKIEFVLVDITAPKMEEMKQFMREKAKKREGQRVAIPPQIFNTETYCGASSHSIHSIHDSCLFM